MSSTPPTEPRPKMGDAQIWREIAKTLTPRVEQWCGEGVHDPETLEDALTDVFCAMKVFNAFDVGTALRDVGWQVDGNLIAILQAADSMYPLALDVCVREWVLRTGFRREIKPEDLVIFQYGKRHQVNGAVRYTHSATARAFVDCVIGSALVEGMVVPYEDIKRLSRDGQLIFDNRLTPDAEGEKVPVAEQVDALTRRYIDEVPPSPNSVA